MVSPALVSLCALVRASQAGGGGGFGGGGGGGGGDLEGLGEILFWLIRFAIEVPALGVPLLVGVVVVFLIGTRRGWWKHQERVIRRYQPQRVAQASLRSAAMLREKDPAFDTTRFLDRAASAFRTAQSAWCAQDLESLRSFVSDGVFERFSLQIAEQREDGWRQGMQGLRLGRLSIQHFTSGRQFDTLTVRIPFDCDIHRVSLETAKRIAYSKLPREHFEECWSFVRRRGARTRSGAGLIEGKCPNCGAPLAMNQSARCGTCECLVRSGEFDWVLAEITQASEWRPEDELGIPGLAVYAERDPGLSVQLLEDRVSVAFWRWSAAERQGRVDPLLRVADTELCERAGAELETRAKSERSYLADRAVGSVRTLGILPGDERDRAVVEVVWDGCPVTLAPGARVPAVRASERRSLRRTLFVLSRRAGATTRLDDAFTTTHCRNCGAHDAGGTAPTCPYCGAQRTGDASTWLVYAILGQADPLASRIQNELAQSAAGGATAARLSASGLLAWAAEAVRADGEIDERERRAVRRLGERFGLSPERVDALLANGNAAEVAPLPRDPAEARAWLAALCELVLADGMLGHAEQVFLREAAGSLGMPALELKRSLQAARSALYREAKHGDSPS